MNCEEIDAILDEHGIRLLAAARRADVDLHLTRCERCSDAWAVHETLVSEPAAAPPAGLFAATVARAVAGARTREPTQPRSRSAPRRGVGLGLAAAAAVAAVAIALATQQRARDGATERPESVPARSAAGPYDLLERAEPDSRYLVGRDYERLPTPAPTASAPGRIEVCEFFMFGCVHCYALEGRLDRWERAKPEHVDLVRVPAIFNATARLHAQAFYAAEALGIAAELHGPFYEEIHVLGNPLDTTAALEAFFGRFGIDAAAFRAAFESPAVEADVERAAELGRRYRVSATPSIGVNGKYLTNAAMTGSAEALFEVVDSLIASEAAEACRERDSTRCPLR